MEYSVSIGKNKKGKYNSYYFITVTSRELLDLMNILSIFQSSYKSCYEVYEKGYIYDEKNKSFRMMLRFDCEDLSMSECKKILNNYIKKDSLDKDKQIKLAKAKIAIAAQKFLLK